MLQLQLQVFIRFGKAVADRSLLIIGLTLNTRGALLYHMGVSYDAGTLIYAWLVKSIRLTAVTLQIQYQFEFFSDTIF